MSYHLTRICTGHGHLMSYLANVGKKISTKWLYCDGVKEDAEYTLLACRKLDQARNQVEKKTGTKLNVDNLVDIMIKIKMVHVGGCARARVLSYIRRIY